MSCYVIGEIGINHNGSLDTTKQLISLAKDCGVDAVKFQKRTINIVYSTAEREKPRESPWGTTNGQQKEGLEFHQEQYDEIDAYCKDMEIDWFASAWDIPSLRFLSQYDCPHNKIASPMLTNAGFVDAVIAEGVHTYVSTGMTDLQTIHNVAAKFRKADCPFTLMHCVSTYPTADHDLHLARIWTLHDIHDRVGYSGHEIGPYPSICAVWHYGVEAIERHITLDRSMYGSDQAASLEEKGLRLMVDQIRKLDMYTGTWVKTISKGEELNAGKLRYWEAA